jgi:hypothetical protein
MSPETNYAHRTDEKRALWSMKISPRLKYLAGIAARAEGKTLSNYVEAALERSFQSVRITDDQEGTNSNKVAGKTLADLADALYTGSEADRFLTLLRTAPWLFSDGESRLMLILQHSDYYYPQLNRGHRVWHSEHIREHWLMLAAIRDGEADIDLLPVEAQPNPELGFGLMNDKERIARYKADPAKFKRESEAYRKAMKGTVK